MHFSFLVPCLEPLTYIQQVILNQPDYLVSQPTTDWITTKEKLRRGIVTATVAAESLTLKEEREKNDIVGIELYSHMVQ